MYTAALKECPNCKEAQLGGERVVGRGSHTASELSDLMGKAVKGKISEMLICIIAASLALFIPQMLGLPPQTYLAVGLVFVAFYIMFPSESQVLKDVEPGEELSGNAMGYLIMKAMLKFMYMFFIMINFFSINRIIFLGVAFYFFFQLPAGYKTSQPYKMILAWLKLFVGLIITVAMYMTFEGYLTAPLTLMSAAFFITIPVHKEDEEGGVVTVNIGKRASSELRSLELLIFSFFMITSLLLMLGVSAFGFSGMGALGDVSADNVMVVLFVSVWIMSFITGWTAGPASRPYVGIIMILISFFAFSTTYTNTVGTSIFGYWWPQIDSAANSVIAPMSSALTVTQTGLGDAWEIMTCPTCFFTRKDQEELAVKSVSEGSKNSIEATSFEVRQSIEGRFNPEEPLIGTAEIENKGEFNAKYVKLDIWASWKDSRTKNTISGTALGSFKTLICDGQKVMPSGHVGQCTWGIKPDYDGQYFENTNAQEHIYPESIKYADFVYNPNDWSSGEEVDLTDIDEESEIEVYLHAGEALKVNLNITYDYSVNVSIPIEIIDKDRYTSLLRNRQIQLVDYTSEYTGGPVKATLATPKQPFRTGELSSVVASIVNEGNGLVEEAEFIIAIHKNMFEGAKSAADAANIADMNSNFDKYGSCTFDDFPPPSDYYLIKCRYNSEMVKGEIKMVNFFVKPDSTVFKDVERTTQLLTGYVGYLYRKTTTKSLTIIDSPR